MVFLDVALFGLLVGRLLVGRLLGGRVRALADTKIVATWLVFVAIGLQMVAFPWSCRSRTSSRSVMS
jgi:hypothetical protein